MDEATLRHIATHHLASYSITPATVPEWYLEALKKHALVFKNDLNFQVQLQPNKYGRILCLEAGCQKYVDLGPRQGPSAYVMDDGRSVGFGGFLQYQVHTKKDTHGKSRVQRLKSEKESTAASRPADNTNPKVASGGVLTALNTTSQKVRQYPDKARIPASANLVVDSRRLTIGGPAPQPPLDRNASGKATRRKRPSNTAEELFGSSLSVVMPPPPPARASKKMKPSPVISPVPSPNIVLNPMHNNKRKPRKSSTRAQARASYPGTSTAKRESSPPIPPAAPNSILEPFVSNKPLSHVQPRTSLPATLPVKGENVSPTPTYGLSQANARYGPDSDDDMDMGWAQYVPKPRMNLNDVLLELAGSTFDENATVEQALKKLSLPDSHTRLSGMSSVLLPHQILGVAWMREREAHTERGGILADEMGLGKTYESQRHCALRVYLDLIPFLCLGDRLSSVQTIALMMQNRSDDPAVKTTLILAPTALLLQWKAELELHTDGEQLRVLVYHGAAKKKHTTKKSLQKYDVVVTTYATVAMEKPSYDELNKKRKKKDDFVTSDSEYDSEEKAKKDGPLISFPWYRIVLDEAQTIRNHRTRASQVTRELHAEYRWCLTGTPITNSLQDAYALFSFLGIRPWNDWTDFRDHILTARLDAKISSTRLQVIFRKCLLRRRKDSTLDGKPLIILPSRTKDDVELEFSPEERQTYDAISARAQAVFNRYLRAGTVLKNYSHVFVMLLRLRQICVHPCLIAENMDVFRTPDEIEAVKERECLNEVLGRARREQGQPYVDKMLALQKAKVDARIAAEKESLDTKIEEDPCPVCREPLMADTAYALVCCHALCEDCLDHVMQTPYVADSSNVEKYKDQERPCPTCRAPISKQHAYLQAAFDPVIPIEIPDSDEDIKPTISSKLKAKTPRARGKPVKKEDMDGSFEDSPKIKAPGRRAFMPRNAKTRATKKSFLGSDSDSDDSLDDFIVHTDSDEEEKDRIKAARVQGKKVIRTRPHKVKDEDESDDDEYESDDAESDEDDKKRIFAREVDEEVMKKPMAKPLASFLPSTKMLHMMEILKEWRDSAPNDKCMIISQWTSVLELCSAYLSENAFDHLSFIGKMSLRQRDDAVNRFKNERDIKVLLMSMKAGGVGLNLTAANRVILLDLGWSPAVENQAFDRVHRLGQQKKVEIYRLVIRDTVEARVLELQKRKQGLMDGSLGEGTVRRQNRLSVRELAALFGMQI